MQEQIIDQDKAAARQARDDVFFGNLKDFVEMMKCWGLGTAFIAAGFSVIASGLPIGFRLLGAMASLVVGLMIVIASVVIHSRHRMAAHGQTRGQQLERMARFSFLMVSGLLVCGVTAEVIKHKMALSAASVAAEIK
ncbi:MULTISPECIES: hypothetical protein [Xanthomonas]|uniref:hypothetical protein n=1 Tax=Xanthomonas cannabis TaxID=1885674 RepID=UPI00160D7262|nr:hypothetical protein [Xanthomonas campestris pv. zinniae]